MSNRFKGLFMSLALATSSMMMASGPASAGTVALYDQERLIERCDVKLARRVLRLDLDVPSNLAGLSDTFCGCQAVTVEMIEFIRRHRNFEVVLDQTGRYCPGFARVLTDVATASISSPARDSRMRGDDNPGRRGASGRDDPRTGDPAKDDDKPSSKVDKPSSKVDEPTGKDDKPSGKDDKPSGKDDKPSGKDDKPAGKDDKPADDGKSDDGKSDDRWSGGDDSWSGGKDGSGWSDDGWSGGGKGGWSDGGKGGWSDGGKGGWSGAGKGGWSGAGKGGWSGGGKGCCAKADWK